MSDMEQRPGLLENLRQDPAARAVLDAISHRHEVYLVGGAVRDAVLGLTPLDLDFVVEGDAREVAAAVAETLGGELREHDRFGTARIKVGDHTYDFASGRAESYEYPGALPRVSPAGIEEDLRRRDFTANAMALSTDSGQFVAASHALEDLRRRRLRVLHEASFKDDPTRLLRLARYAARLGFEVEAGTAVLAKEAIEEGALETVSGPRVGQELRLAAREADAIAAFERLDGLGALRAVHLHLSFDAGFASRALAILPPEGRSNLVVLAASMRDLTGQEADAVLDRLGFDRDETRLALALILRLPATSSDVAAARRPSEIDALLAGSTPEEAALIAVLGAEEPVRRWLGELRDAKLEIDGADLRAAGVPEGPAIGAALAFARAGRLDGDLMTREAQLAFALRMAGT